MARPGPKTSQDEVKTAVIRLLKGHPNGLNFNEVFRKLKERKVLGSFSVLSRAMKDLYKAGVVKYEDAQVSRFKIPKRVYKLTEPMERELRQMYMREREKEKVPLNKIVLDESLLHHLFWTHMNNMVTSYRDLLHEDNPTDENARWKLILNYELAYIRAFMDAVAKAVSEGEIPIEEAGKVAFEVHKRMMHGAEAKKQG